MERVRGGMGFRVHPAWAALVVVAAPPEVILRRRIDIVDPKGDGVKQPYHAAAEMDLADAKKHIARCLADARTRARAEIERAIASLTGIRVIGAAMTLSSGRLPARLAIAAPRTRMPVR